MKNTVHMIFCDNVCFLDFFFLNIYVSKIHEKEFWYQDSDVFMRVVSILTKIIIIIPIWLSGVDHFGKSQQRLEIRQS